MKRSFDTEELVSPQRNLRCFHSFSDNVSVTEKNPRSKKLLIIDLNKVLVLRKHRKSFSIRPFAKQFLIDMSHRFHLAIWTSGTINKCKKMVNKLLSIGKQPRQEDGEKTSSRLALLFEWYQDRCTLLECDIESDVYSKPLFTKNLTSVWKNFPEFTEANTVMIDDSMEKCASNPEHTLISPLPYTALNINDVELKPNGKLWSYLERLAEYPGSVRDFICQENYVADIALPVSSECDQVDFGDEST